MPNSTRSKKKSRSPIDIFYEARKLSKRTKLNRRAKSYSKKSRSPIDIFYEARKLSKRTKLNRRAKSYGKGTRKSKRKRRGGCGCK